MSRKDDFWLPYLLAALTFTVMIILCISDYQSVLTPFTEYGYKDMKNGYITLDRIGGPFLVVGLLFFLLLMCVAKLYFIWKSKH